MGSDTDNRSVPRDCAVQQPLDVPRGKDPGPALPPARDLNVKPRPVSVTLGWEKCAIKTQNPKPRKKRWVGLQTLK